jgi:hypothetical protein
MVEAFVHLLEALVDLLETFVDLMYQQLNIALCCRVGFVGVQRRTAPQAEQNGAAHAFHELNI